VLLRRAFEVHHIIFLDTHGIKLDLFVVFSEIYMIVNTFALIQFHDSFHPMTATAYITFTLYVAKALQMNVALAAKLTKASKESGGSQPFWTPSQYISVYWKGRPLSVVVGKSVKLTQGTFLFIMNDIVISSVINLLLMLQ